MSTHFIQKNTHGHVSHPPTWVYQIFELFDQNQVCTSLFVLALGLSENRGDLQTAIYHRENGHEHEVQFGFGGTWFLDWWYTYPLKNMSSSVGILIPNIWENKKCSKPPVRYCLVRWDNKPNNNHSPQERGLPCFSIILLARVMCIIKIINPMSWLLWCFTNLQQKYWIDRRCSSRLG